ncbi:MAG: phosphate ABC transporter substrate-binding protein PstS, partial [Acidobacteria bacterium]
SASLTDPPGARSFPITSYDWLYLRTNSGDPKRAAALHDFLDWVFSVGQQIAASSGYSELPTPLRAKIGASLREVK